MEFCLSVGRAFENIPIIGHGVAALYGCCKKKDQAERAGIKATIGIVFAVVNFPAEAIDECSRKRSPKLRSDYMGRRSDWMRKHHQRVLKSICLPASHQSASAIMAEKLKPIPTVEGWSRCQGFSIEQQLIGGVRFLDLRIMTHKSDVWTHHNMVVCVTLKNILATVRDFVAKHPTEIVGLYMTSDGKPLDWGLVHTYLNEYVGGRLIHEHMKDMLIGDIVDQGKNVIIFGVPNVAYSWRGLDYRWPQKSWPDELRADMENTMSEETYNPSEALYWYKAECTPNTAMVVRSTGGLPGLIWRGKADEKFEFVKDMAAAANCQVLDLLQDQTSNPFNVISTDFVNDDIIKRIIELNDVAEKGVFVDTVDLAAEADDVFADNPTINLTHATVTLANESFRSNATKQSNRSLNRSINSSVLGTSFEIKVKPGPALAHKETGI